MGTRSVRYLFILFVLLTALITNWCNCTDKEDVPKPKPPNAAAIKMCIKACMQKYYKCQRKPGCRHPAMRRGKLCKSQLVECKKECTSKGSWGELPGQTR